LLVFLLFSLPALAAPPVLRGEAEQGGVIFGQAAAGSKLFLDGMAVPVDGAGRFVLGFARDAAPRAVLRGVERSGAVEETLLAVRPRAWPVQRIDGLPQDKVTPPPALLARIREDNRAVAEARARIGGKADYLSGFVVPVEGIVSGVFGSQRILNGEAKAPHSGLDLAAAAGTPVQAAADGVVSLAHPDMFYTGRTVMIDHGLGLQTVYAHLSRIDVKVGQRVRRGQIIGAVGASGRATGPHLHWGASWLDRRLDPARLPEILPITPQTR
jgi:murein DD-endopeptidase MepM/ murein hydrolase activator NlpD